MRNHFSIIGAQLVTTPDPEEWRSFFECMQVCVRRMAELACDNDAGSLGVLDDALHEGELFKIEIGFASTGAVALYFLAIGTDGQVKPLFVVDAPEMAPLKFSRGPLAASSVH